MSKDTFTVKPLTEVDTREVTRMHLNAKSCGPCWLCGYRTTIARWGAHTEKHRRENWKPRVFKSTKTRAEVMAEWGECSEEIAA